MDLEQRLDTIEQELQVIEGELAAIKASSDAQSAALMSLEVGMRKLQTQVAWIVAKLADEDELKTLTAQLAESETKLSQATQENTDGKPNP
jgi:septation ring formation regulator EzrA